MLDQLAWTRARQRDVRNIDKLATIGKSNERSAVGDVSTSTDTLTLWNSTPFNDVVGFRGWREQVAKPLPTLVRAGTIVPFTTWNEGRFSVRVSLDASDVSDRERTYTEWTSEPYVLSVDNGIVCLSGLEAVGNPGVAAFQLELPPGRYAVRGSILAWDEEPGALDGGTRAPHALPALLVTIGPADDGAVFRTSIHSYGPCSCG